MKWMFIIFIVLIIFVLYFLYKYYRVGCCNGSERNIAIVLTMYVGQDKKRLQKYIETINNWLNNTPYDIFIVESSGYTFNIQNPRPFGRGSFDPRLFQYSFIQGTNTRNLSLLEKDSLLKLYKRYEEKLLSYDYIFKVTGKYFIPNFKPNIGNDVELIVQNQVFTNGQNSELVGMKSSLFYEIISTIDDNFEEHLDNIINKYKTCRLPPAHLATYFPRNDGIVLTYL